MGPHPAPQLPALSKALDLGSGSFARKQSSCTYEFALSAVRASLLPIAESQLHKYKRVDANFFGTTVSRETLEHQRGRHERTAAASDLLQIYTGRLLRPYIIAAFPLPSQQFTRTQHPCATPAPPSTSKPLGNQQQLASSRQPRNLRVAPVTHVGRCLKLGACKRGCGWPYHGRQELPWEAPSTPGAPGPKWTWGRRCHRPRCCACC